MDFILEKYGDLPILLSSCHSVEHFRKCQIKYGEYMTGVIVTILRERLKCSGITKVVNNFTDPNYDPRHAYRDCCVNYVQSNNILFFFDFHIMSDKHENDIEILTNYGKNIQGNNNYGLLIKDIFECNGFKTVIDNNFDASKEFNVSGVVSRKTNIPCIQFEINWRLLNFESPFFNFNCIIDGLENLILHLTD